MKLTPLDIKKQEFKRTLRGYDPVEVEAFLEMVADELEAVIREKNQLADEVLKLRTQLQDYQQVEKTLKETLVNAQENITASRQTSQREADMILREAELKAEKIIENARMRLERLKNDIMIIKAQKESFARRLRHLLESQIELINVLEMDDVGYEEGRQRGPSKATAADSGSREGENSTAFQRKKIDIPVQRNAPAKTDGASRPAPKEASEEAKTEEGTPKKRPKISDQFIT